MSTKWIVPGIIPVELMYSVPDRCIEAMAEVSTDIIIMYVNKFIETGLKSEDMIERSVAKKIQRCYETVNARIAYLNSDEVKQIAEELNGLTFENISASVSIDKLKTWQKAINEVLSNENAIAYTTLLDKDSLQACLDKLTAYASDEESVNTKAAIINLRSILEKHKGSFKNAPFKKNNPTVLRQIVYNKDNLQSIANGLQFLIPRLERGENPIKWRYL